MATTRGCLEFQAVAFFYDTAGAAVFDGLSVRFSPGWTGVIGPNGSGKTTLLRQACGELEPVRGLIRLPDEMIYCPQRTDDAPAELVALVCATDHSACELRGRLGIADDWPTRWATLSHGERKRAQIAVALWRAPRVLAVDEPTNHIDALRGFRGVGLMVSHDRDLLDALCRKTLFIEPPTAVLRPGGYTKAVELARAEHDRARELRGQARREHRRLRREAVTRREAAAKSHKERSKRGLSAKNHDARAKKDLARATGKDAQAGRVLRQLEGRLGQAEDRLAETNVKKEHRLGIELAAARSQRDAMFRIPAGEIALGSGRRLVYPELVMRPADRIALVGPNGGGKSTLVRHVVDRLDLPADRLVYMPQEIDRSRGRDILAAARGLARAGLGEVMSIVSRLGSRPQRLLESDDPSPGELRKILLAVGIARQPHLIVMDEPTNHLDLPSIECLESALADCRCGLLLVSHDMRSLQELTRLRWEISPDAGEASDATMRLHVTESAS